MKSAPAIVFDYRPSRRLLAALTTVALLAIVAIACSGLAWWWKLALGLAGSAVAGLELLRLSRPAIVRCAWYAEGHWRVRDTDNNEHAATLRTATVRGPLIVIVLSAGPLRRISLVLLPDNCDADCSRRLRVRLAYAATVAAA